MNWLDPSETFDEKLNRILDAIRSREQQSIILVGESAGASMALAALARHGEMIVGVITSCGKNRGVATVRESIFRKHKAFKHSLTESQEAIDSFSTDELNKILVVYSSLDRTVRPADTLIQGTKSIDLKTPGHLKPILYMLFIKYRNILP